MSKFRCRRCDLVVTDPLEHAEFFHDLPSTMAQVWEGFTLVASDHSKRALRSESEQPPEEVPTLW